MHSPIFRKIWHPWWHSFPIWVISSITSLHWKHVPTGRDLKSIPCTTRFSPKAPSSTSAPRARNSSILSCERRLTCRCHYPAWASPSIPNSSINTPSPIFCFCVPFSGLMHTAVTFPIIYINLRSWTFLSSQRFLPLSSYCRYSFRLPRHFRHMLTRTDGLPVSNKSYASSPCGSYHHPRHF